MIRRVTNVAPRDFPTTSPACSWWETFDVVSDVMAVVDALEELERRIDAARTRRQRVDLMLELSHKLRARDPVRGRRLAGEALRIARDLSYRLGVGLAHLHAADCDRFAGELGRALRSFDRAGRYLRADDDGAKHMPHLLRGKGAVLFALGRVPESIDALEESLMLYRAVGDTPNVATTLAFLGDAYRELGDYPRALHHLEESLDLAELIGQAGHIGLALANLSCIHGDLRDLEVGLGYARRALEIARETGSPFGCLNILRNIGSFRLLRNERPEARAAFAEAAEIVGRFGAVPVLVSCLANIAEIDIVEGKREDGLGELREACAVELGDEETMEHGVAHLDIGNAWLAAGESEMAIASFDRAIAISQACRSYSTLLNAVEAMAVAHEQQGNDNLAIRYFLRYRELRRNIENQRTQRVLAQIESRRKLHALEEERLRADERVRALAAELERREAEIAAISLRLSQREELVSRLQGDVMRYSRGGEASASELARMLADRLQSGASDAVGWSALEERIVAVQDGFLNGLSGTCPDLTSTELKICANIHVGLSNKEIAAVTASSIHTVNTHRRNIRRKLKLEQGASLDVMLAGRAS